MELQDVIALDKQYYMNTFGNRIPIMFTGGHGSTVIDSEGNEYIDFLAGIAVNALGYNHPALVDAICKQAKTLLHCSNYFYIEKQAILAKMLCENSCADKVFFANSGAEANEGAFKLIRKYFKDKGEQRYEVISTLNSFHGRTLATVTATGQPKYSAAYSPLPEGFTLVPYGDINAVKAAITPKTAAVLIEVIQGEGGIIEGGQTYLSAVRQLCNETGILLMIDEVQTGMGRTGKLFAHQHYGIEPDIFTTAKALGGGVPIGALMCKDHVSVFGPGDHGSTFGGNPLACAAGVAVMSELTKPGFLDNVAKLGTYFKGKLCALQQKYPSKIVDVRGLGLILGVQFAPDLSIDTVHKAALGKKFILGKAGMNTLRLVPPLVITTAEIDALIDLLDEILKGV